MRWNIVICTLFFSALLMLAAPRANAQVEGPGCYLTLDNWKICTGSGGCRDDYDNSQCFLGCTHGFCTNQGGSGLCCGHLYYSAEIYPDGDNDLCKGDICGFIRVHFAGAKERDNSLVRPRFQRAELTAPVHYWIQRLIYVPDRCAHTYGLAMSRPLPVGE